MTLTQQRLTDKQEAFCAWYISLKNATQAAIKAGYSEDTAYSIGSENLKKPEIIERLQRIADSTLSCDTATSIIERRKKRLQEVVDHPIETPVSAGHRVAAAKELNLMEKVYATNTDSKPMVAIQVVLPSQPQDSHNSYSAKQLVTPITEAKRLLKGHKWTPEEKTELLREVFGDDVPALPPGETPPTSDAGRRGGLNTVTPPV